MSQRRISNVIIWNDPIPPTLVGASVPILSDPVMFLVGVYGASTNAAMYYPRVRFADIGAGLVDDENIEAALMAKTLLQQNRMLRMSSKTLSDTAHNCEVGDIYTDDSLVFARNDDCLWHHRWSVTR